jgi:alpha/beta superfamily hydrolase
MTLVKIPVADFALVADVATRAGAPAAVVCHPHPAFGGRMDTPLVVALAHALYDAGWSTVRFNFRGLGGSGGVASGGVREHEDVAAAVSWALAEGAPRVALVGYSFGALMAVRAIADGAPVSAFAGVGFPTTILGHDAERVAAVERALDRQRPWLFIGGDSDQFVELDRLRGWVRNRPWARLEILPGSGHFFAGDEERRLCRRVTAFVTDSS